MVHIPLRHLFRDWQREGSVFFRRYGLRWRLVAATFVPQSVVGVGRWIVGGGLRRLSSWWLFPQKPVGERGCAWRWCARRAFARAGEDGAVSRWAPYLYVGTGVLHVRRERTGRRGGVDMRLRTRPCWLMAAGALGRFAVRSVACAILARACALVGSSGASADEHWARSSIRVVARCASRRRRMMSSFGCAASEYAAASSGVAA
jgi:hypothetical protein